jgi:hypothetical protein
MTDQPVWVCADCGIEHGNSEPQFATWHMGTCGVCGDRVAVTEARDFGYLRPSWRGMLQVTQQPESCADANQGSGDQGTARTPVGATTTDAGQSTKNPFPDLLYDLIDEARRNCGR